MLTQTVGQNTGSQEVNIGSDIEVLRLYADGNRHTCRGQCDVITYETKNLSSKQQKFAHAHNNSAS